MRPDITCTNGSAGSRGFGTGDGAVPCGFSYEDSGYKCHFIDKVKAVRQAGGTTKEMLQKLKQSGYFRSIVYNFFDLCIRLVPQSGSGRWESGCIQCGQCCQNWAEIHYATYPNGQEPCKPENYRGRGNPANPCTQVHYNVGSGGWYCDLYGTGSFPVGCEGFPSGRETDLLFRYIRTIGSANISTFETLGSCSFNFIRES